MSVSPAFTYEVVSDLFPKLKQEFLTKQKALVGMEVGQLASEQDQKAFEEGKKALVALQAEIEKLRDFLDTNTPVEGGTTAGAYTAEFERLQNEVQAYEVPLGTQANETAIRDAKESLLAAEQQRDEAIRGAEQTLREAQEQAAQQTGASTSTAQNLQDRAKAEYERTVADAEETFKREQERRKKEIKDATEAIKKQRAEIEEGLNTARSAAEVLVSETNHGPAYDVYDHACAELMLEGLNDVPHSDIIQRAKDNIAKYDTAKARWESIEKLQEYKKNVGVLREDIKKFNDEHKNKSLQGSSVGIYKFIENDGEFSISSNNSSGVRQGYSPDKFSQIRALAQVDGLKFDVAKDQVRYARDINSTLSADERDTRENNLVIEMVRQYAVSNPESFVFSGRDGRLKALGQLVAMAMDVKGKIVPGDYSKEKYSLKIEDGKITFVQYSGGKFLEELVSEMQTYLGERIGLNPNKKLFDDTDKKYAALLEKGAEAVKNYEAQEREFNAAERARNDAVAALQALEAAVNTANAEVTRTRDEVLRLEAEELAAAHGVQEAKDSVTRLEDDLTTLEATRAAKERELDAAQQQALATAPAVAGAASAVSQAEAALASAVATKTANERALERARDAVVRAEKESRAAVTLVALAQRSVVGAQRQVAEAQEVQRRGIEAANESGDVLKKKKESLRTAQETAGEIHEQLYALHPLLPKEKSEKHLEEAIVQFIKSQEEDAVRGEEASPKTRELERKMKVCWVAADINNTERNNPAFRCAWPRRAVRNNAGQQVGSQTPEEVAQQESQTALDAKIADVRQRMADKEAAARMNYRR